MRLTLYEDNFHYELENVTRMFFWQVEAVAGGEMDPAGDAAFAAANRRIVARRKQFVLPMAIHRKLKCAPLSAFLEGCCRCLGLTRLWGTPVIGRWERAD